MALVRAIIVAPTATVAVGATILIISVTPGKSYFAPTSRLDFEEVVQLLWHKPTYHFLA